MAQSEIEIYEEWLETVWARREEERQWEAERQASMWEIEEFGRAA